MEADLQNQLTALQQKWLSKLRACEASGLSVKAFAEREGIDRKRLYSWRKALTQKGLLGQDKSVEFQRAVVKPTVVHGDWHVQLPNGVSIDFRGDVSGSTLAVVLRTAASL